MAVIYGSCKNAIFSSKLYCSSNRKDKIKAQLDNPVNAELIKQLDEYIGDEYRQMNHHTRIDNEKEHENPDENMSSDNNESTEHSSSRPSMPHGGAGGGSPMKLSEKYGEALNTEGEEAYDATHPSESDDTDENDLGLTTSSVKVKKPYVSADTAVPMVFIENHVTLSGLAGEVKGTLNARASTQGVSRVAVKNDELWIYYNDDINLNNVMSDVIELLNASSFHYLIFNRLARTDNAIVFTINCNDTLNAMEPVNNET